MVSRVLSRKLMRDLFQRKGSLLALFAIVMIGVGCFVGMRAVYRDLDESRARYYRDYRLADFSVDMKRAPKWAVEEAASTPNIRELRGRVDLGVLIDLPEVNEPIAGRAISMPPTRTPVLNDILLRRGSWFSEEDAREVILNDAFAAANGLAPGQRIKVLLLDKQHDLLIVGTAMSPEFVYLIPADGGLAPDPARFGVMYLPEKFLQQSGDLDGAYNQVVGKLHNNSERAIEQTLDDLERFFDLYGVTTATPIADQPSVQFLHDELRGLAISATVMPGIFLGVAALVLNVLIGRMVAQQRTTIGTLKAIGYSSMRISRHYMGYGPIIGVVGGALGGLFGAWIQSGMLGIYREFYALPAIAAHRYPDIYLFGFVVSVVFATLGTLKGLRYAASLAPAEAMRPPPPERGGRVFLERFPILWNRFSFKWKMAVRTIIRNPFRSGVSVLGSFISTALVLTAFANTDALEYLMAYTYEKVAHQDVTVVLREPAGERVTSEVANQRSMSRAEPQLSIVCTIEQDGIEERVGLIGIEPGSQLFTPLDASDQPIAIPPEGLILSKALARKLGVDVGESVRLRPLIGERRAVQAPVVGLVDAFLGMPAYADLRYLSRLIGERWAANSVLATAWPGADENRVLRPLKESPFVMGVSLRSRALAQLDATFGETMGIMIGFMVFFSGLIAFGSVLNAALVGLSERQRELGTLRVLGYTPAQVSGIFSGESALLNGLGILLGLAGGAGLATLISTAYSTEYFRFEAVIYFHRLVLAVLIMAGFVGAAQWIVYILIRKLDWLDALKVKE